MIEKSRKKKFLIFYIFKIDFCNSFYSWKFMSFESFLFSSFSTIVYPILNHISFKGYQPGQTQNFFLSSCYSYSIYLRCCTLKILCIKMYLANFCKIFQRKTFFQESLRRRKKISRRVFVSIRILNVKLYTRHFRMYCQ